MPATMTQLIPLRDVHVGDTGRLRVTDAPSSTLQRLMAMGLLPGLLVRVARVAPLGDPIVLEAGKFQVRLRKHEADGMGIEPA